MTTRRPEVAGRELLRCWSAKEVTQLGALLHPDAVLTGPLVPAGRAAGADAICAFLEAENSTRSLLPAEDRHAYEFMARGRARIVHVVADDTTAAFEVSISSGRYEEELPAAVFVALDPGLRSIERVAVYPGHRRRDSS